MLFYVEAVYLETMTMRQPWRTPPAATGGAQLPILASGSFRAEGLEICAAALCKIKLKYDTGSVDDASERFQELLHFKLNWTFQTVTKTNPRMNTLL